MRWVTRVAENEDRDRHHPFHLESGAVVFDKPKTQEERAREKGDEKEDEYKRDQVRTNRRLTLLNLFLVIGTLASSCIGIWQAVSSQKSAQAAKTASDTAAAVLGEMQHGSGAQDTHTLALQAVTQAAQTTNLARDTHDLALSAQTTSQQAVTQAAQTTTLAKAAQRQADQATILAENAGKQADASKTIAERATAQANATNRLAEAADKSAAQASEQLALLQKQLETSQRAWISIVNIQPQFIKFGSNGISLNTNISFHNTGNLPATQVAVQAFVVLGDIRSYALPELQRFQSKVCREARTGPAFGVVQTVFPNETKHFTSGGFGPVNFPTQVSVAGKVEPFVVGCVTYRFSSSKTIHDTGFIYGVIHLLPDGKTEDLTFGKDVPPSEITFSDFWDGEALTENP